jgi:hypothetical protein
MSKVRVVGLDELIRETGRTLSALQEHVMHPVRLRNKEEITEALNVIDGNAALLREYLLGAYKDA